MAFHTKLASLAALLVLSKGILGAPAPCNDPSHTHEPTSTETWGEPTPPSAPGVVISISLGLGDGHHSYSHHRSHHTTLGAPTTPATPSQSWTTTSASATSTSTWGPETSSPSAPATSDTWTSPSVSKTSTEGSTTATSWTSASSSKVTVAPTSSAAYSWTTTSTVTATPTGGATTASCSTGPIQCCNSVQGASTLSPQQNATMHQSYGQDVLEKHGLLGALIGGVDVPIGVDCSPISVIGLGGSSCAATPVCCDNTDQTGLINIGCIPIVLSL